MRFTPKTEKEIQEENLWPTGEYAFEILEAENAVSKSGNDMIKLKVAIYNDDGNRRVAIDYLMEAISYKLRHACEACGLLEKYETGFLEAGDFIGKTGFLRLGVQKDKNGQYPDKNAVNDYLKPGDEKALSHHNTAKGNGYQPQVSDPLGDEIPF